MITIQQAYYHVSTQNKLEEYNRESLYFLENCFEEYPDEIFIQNAISRNKYRFQDLPSIMDVLVKQVHSLEEEQETQLKLKYIKEEYNVNQ